jgi:hypothetical protein
MSARFVKNEQLGGFLIALLKNGQIIKGQTMYEKRYTCLDKLTVV